MPFGLSTAPEEYQRRQEHAVGGLSGIHCVADEYSFLCTVKVTQKKKLSLTMIESYKHWWTDVENVDSYWTKTNSDCDKRKWDSSETFINSEGLKPDPEKVKAVRWKPNPEDVADVRGFLEFANYLSKFLPSLSDLCEPLRKLTLKDAIWSSHEVRDKAVAKIKR